MTDDAASPPPAEENRFLRSLRRYARFQELNAQEEHLLKERRICWARWAESMMDTGQRPAWPPELEETAIELGLTGTPSPAFAADLARLGESPSTLSRTEPNAVLQREHGYDVTDYAGLFRRSGMFLTGSLSGGVNIVEPPTVAFLGEARISSGRLATFDPFDETSWDRTVQQLDRDVPTGPARIYLAHQGDDAVALLWLFGNRPVAAWAPARPNAAATPMPVPPRLPMSAVRFGICVADAALIDALLKTPPPAQAQPEEAQLLETFGTPAPDAKTGGPPQPSALKTLRALARENGLFALSTDLVGVAAGWGPFASSWGIDADGGVAAYAVDFGMRRLHPRNRDSASRPAVQLSRHSLAARAEPLNAALPRDELEAFAAQLAGEFIDYALNGPRDRLLEALAELDGYARL